MATGKRGDIRRREKHDQWRERLCWWRRLRGGRCALGEREGEDGGWRERETRGQDGRTGGGCAVSHTNGQQQRTWSTKYKTQKQQKTDGLSPATLWGPADRNTEITFHNKQILINTVRNPISEQPWSSTSPSLLPPSASSPLPLRPFSGSPLAS